MRFRLGFRSAGGDAEVAAFGERLAAVDDALRSVGFFLLTGHGVTGEQRARVRTAAREFFALPIDVKERVGLTTGGTAWRGWFPLGGELTSQRPDWKEGLYLGRELGPDAPLHFTEEKNVFIPTD